MILKFIVLKSLPRASKSSKGKVFTFKYICSDDTIRFDDVCRVGSPHYFFERELISLSNSKHIFVLKFDKNQSHIPANSVF
jgi:hypothetical protein